jgi:hypothetical protein
MSPSEVSNQKIDKFSDALCIVLKIRLEATLSASILAPPLEICFEATLSVTILAPSLQI